MEFRKVSELKPNPLNPRGEVRHDIPLRELAMSIKSQGLLQPILITPDGTIVAGHRRAAAAKLADLDEVPVIIKAVSEIEQIAIMLTENIQRQDLNPVQEGKAYLLLIERGLTINKISKAVGVGGDALTLRVTIARLPEAAHVVFAEGKLPVGCAKCLQYLAPETAGAWVLKAAENGWTGTELTMAIHKDGSEGATPPPEEPRLSPTILDRIWERIEDGCYTFDSITKCGECLRDIFGLTSDEIEPYFKKLVSDGKAEWRTEGRRPTQLKGEPTKMIVPVNVPSADFLGTESSPELSLMT